MPTPNKNIWTPTGATDLTPLQTPFAALANSVDDALVAQDKTIPALYVANVAERNAKYPSPKQGDRVWRNDTGWQETYYGAYNAGSNPGGASPAGWYPTGGKMPRFVVLGSGDASIPNQSQTVLTNWASPETNVGMTSWSGGILTVAYTGIYSMTASTFCGAATQSQGILMTPGSESRQEGPATSIAFRRRLAAGDTVRLAIYQFAGSPQLTLASNQHLSVAYEGPA